METIASRIANLSHSTRKPELKWGARPPRRSFPRPRGKHQTHRKVGSIVNPPSTKEPSSGPYPATPEAGVLPNFRFRVQRSRPFHETEEQRLARDWLGLMGQRRQLRFAQRREFAGQLDVFL